MVPSDPWDYPIYVTTFHPLKRIAGGVNPMRLSDPSVYSLEIISLKIVKMFFWGLTQWSLFSLGPNLLIFLPCSQRKNARD